MKTNPQSGFTLVEVLVALLILSVGLVPAFLQANLALSSSAAIQNSLTAGNLAQEGIEVVHAMRDANWFAGQPFDTGLTVCGAGCMVQWDSTSVIAGPAVPLKVSATGLYQYASGTVTPFTRRITIAQVSAVQLKVTSTVTWSERGQNKSLILESYLFNWYQ